MNHAEEIRLAMIGRDAPVSRARSLAAIAAPSIERKFLSPIAQDSVDQRERNVKQSAWVEAHINPPRSPLEDAATDLSMAVADFYVLLDRAKTANDITAMWTMLQQMEQLVSACASAAGRKADAL